MAALVAEVIELLAKEDGRAASPANADGQPADEPALVASAAGEQGLVDGPVLNEPQQHDQAA